VIGLLLIGFNRPDLLEARLHEVIPVQGNNTQLYIAIDGPRENNPKDIENQNKIRRIIENVQESNVNLQVSYQETNLGCDLHMEVAISWAMKNCEAVVLVEDDVTFPYSIVKMGIISGMGTFQVKGIASKFIKTNKWRKTRYFSTWGCLIPSDFWSGIQKRDISSEMLKELAQKSAWNELANYQKNIWLDRFTRDNIHYRIQLEVFLQNIKVDAPQFRIVENVGLGDSRATHTYHKRPISMFGIGPSDIYPNSKDQIKSKIVQKIFEFIDSHTWAGDGFLSSRGRVIGIRTLVKKSFLK
jgi:hypothetical protein